MVKLRVEITVWVEIELNLSSRILKLNTKKRVLIFMSLAHL